MALVFGEVAALYDDVRPGYRAELRQAIGERAPAGPAVDIGAGTGKGTEVLLAIRDEVTAIEPDPRMAAVLRAKFPAVDVLESTFEEWTPPPGGAGLLACAMAWHWMDAATRNQRAAAALAPEGVLAVFGHRFAYADEAQSAAIGEVFDRARRDVPMRPEHWIADDVRGSGVWASVDELEWREDRPLSTEGYLDLTRTFSPFRRHSPELQRRVLDDLRATIDGFGGTIALDLRTSLVLAVRHR
ncbi:methyltransferase type 11 [Paractinoplanes deccanensis]|uniref:Methyltransferase type 11 n=1 Tax=Paractinoplanes deccanensis TaxID=113561 RepID=A0ABQ3Y8V1_9ACTN|nr:methyltransferase domain-containing protein [Actinoplanes deccanensis]GID76423.1 methyltransferase type 11 [Actinoplanes deccanensis]